MEKKTVNLLDLGGKASSKSELYRLLTSEGHLYLPPYKLCSVDFIAEIIDEQRIVSLNPSRLKFCFWFRHWKPKTLLSEVYHRSRVWEQETFWTFSLANAEVRTISPENIKTCRWTGTGSVICVSRFVQNIIGNSINLKEFDEFVKSKLVRRQEILMKANNLTIKTNAKFANIFGKSMMVSSE